MVDIKNESSSYESDTNPPLKKGGGESRNTFYYIKWIVNEWRPFKYYTLLLLFLTLLSTGVTVVYPILLRNLIDTIENSLVEAGNIDAINPIEVNSDDPMSPIYRIAIILMLVGVVRLIASLYPFFRGYMNLLFEFLLRQRYFKNILEKDYRFFLRFRTGDIITRLTNDIQDWPKISWFMCSGIFRAFDSLVKIIFCIVIMFFLSWNLTLLTLVPIPLMILAFYRVSEILQKRFQKNQEAISEINNQLEMSFSGIKIIKSFVCEDKYQRFFDKALLNRFDTEINLVKTQTLMHLIYEYIDFFALIAVILYGGYLTVVGSISIGTFVAFYAYLSMLVYPILDLPQLFTSGKQAFVCIDRLDEIKDFPVKNYSNNSNEKQIISDIQSIRFDKVSFSYEDRNVKILNSISFDIKKGEKILILGRSGAGKTTILGLLCGQLIPDEGEIFVNDIPLRFVDDISLRDLLGYVPQEPSLFTGTIRDNVLFAMKKQSPATNNDYYDTVISAVQMTEEIAQFVEKDETKLGIKGLSLSGGQKQRIAIARALYKKPQVLILDDITASLDAKKEELLWEQISSIFNELTAFIVSHRLSSLRYADNVMFIEDGKINAYGKHQVLIKENKNYIDFVKHHYKMSSSEYKS
ncbi:MAG: ABC transporter ATP-binding protein/permease [Candidatus Cloacimonetes bacterium]|nr:ABC transporter ATP-binding protein/permease [Candidatus Cloacimonadota bacterium]